MLWWWRCIKSENLLKALKRSRGMETYVTVCVFKGGGDRNRIFNYCFPNAYYVIGIFIYNDTYILWISAFKRIMCRRLKGEKKIKGNAKAFKILQRLKPKKSKHLDKWRVFFQLYPGTQKYGTGAMHEVRARDNSASDGYYIMAITGTGYAIRLRQKG